jgi:hypothetical protein
MLLKLPAWAQTLIRESRLTPAHGKYLTPAMASDKVINIIEKKYNKEADDPWKPDVKGLRQEIYFSFAREHPELTGYTNQFDYQKKCVKTGCKKYKKISSESGEGTFCLDRQCYANFQTEAHDRQQKKIETQRAKHEDKDQPVIEVKADKDNKVDTRQLDLCPDFMPLEDGYFDRTGCIKCPQCHTAITNSVDNEPDEYTACFNVNCFNEKDASHDQANKTISQHMITTVTQKLIDDPVLTSRFMVWIAADSPWEIRNRLTNGEEFIAFDGPVTPSDDEDFEEVLLKHRLFSLPQFLMVDERVIPKLLEKILDGYLAHRVFIELWKYFELEVTDFQLDAEYINCMNEKQLRKLVDKDGLPPALFAELNMPTLDITQLREKVSKHSEHFKAPVDEIRWAYQQLIKDEGTEET